MNISDLKLVGLMDGITTVGEFLEKYTNIYPAINEKEFSKHLEKLDKEILKKK